MRHSQHTVTKYLSIFLQCFISLLTHFNDLNQFPSNFPRGSLTFNSSKQPSYALRKTLWGYTHELEGPASTQHCPTSKSRNYPTKGNENYSDANPCLVLCSHLSQTRINMARKLNKACSCSSLLETQGIKSPTMWQPKASPHRSTSSSWPLAPNRVGKANFRNQRIWSFSKQIHSTTCQEVPPATLWATMAADV